MAEARLVLRDDGSLSYAIASGARQVYYHSDGHRRDTVLVLDDDAWGQAESVRGSGDLVLAVGDGGVMYTRSVVVTPLPDGGKQIHEKRLDINGNGDVTYTAVDPQGNVTGTAHGRISAESREDVNAEGHVVTTGSETTTWDPDSVGDTVETTRSHSDDTATGTTTDAKTTTQTDANGEIVSQQKTVTTKSPDGTWSETTVSTDESTGVTTIDTRTGDRAGNEYHDTDTVDKNGNLTKHQHDEKHPDGQGEPEPGPAPEPDPEPDPNPDPDPDPDPDGGGEKGRPADDGTWQAPRGPGGIVGKLIQDFIDTHSDEGDGSEDRPGRAVGRAARDLITGFLRPGGPGAPGGLGEDGPPSGLVADLRMPVPPGAIDDWGDHNDPRMSVGLALALTALAERLHAAAGRLPS